MALGVEVGPKEIGLDGDFGQAARIRFHAETYAFDSIRRMAGVVFTV